MKGGPTAEFLFCPHSMSVFMKVMMW